MSLPGSPTPTAGGDGCFIERSISAPSPSLPQELVDRIIDLLRADRATLSACSRVCRGWRPRSQKHLFSHIQVALHSSQFGVVQPLIDFLYGHPALAACIRKLTLTGAEKERLNADTLAGVLQNLPYLDVLNIAGVVLDAPVPGAHKYDLLYDSDEESELPYLASSSGTKRSGFRLQRLTLLQTGYEPKLQTPPQTGKNSAAKAIQSLLSVLGLFAQIDHVIVETTFSDMLESLDIGRIFAQHADMVPEHLSIGGLEVLDYPCAVAFWTMLLSRTATVRLTRLCLLCGEPWMYETVRPLMQKVGGSVERLQISLGGLKPLKADTVFHDLGLSYCTNLETCAIAFSIPGPLRLAQVNSLSWPQLCNFIDDIAAPSTLRILELGCPRIEHFTSDPGTNFKELLLPLHKLTALECLVFVEPSIPHKRTTEHLRQRMGSLAERLRVCGAAPTFLHI